MQDLSANLFYKAKFTISTNDANNDLLWKLVLEIKNWLTTKWNKDNHLIVDPDIKKWTRFKNTGRIYDEENTNHVYAESALHISEDSITTSWACKVVEKNDPIEGYAQREWITEIGYQSSRSNEAELSYVVTYNDLPGFIGFCEDTPSITVPRIIRHLLTDNSIECKIGANQLSFWPIQLKVGEYPTFKKILYRFQFHIR